MLDRGRCASSDDARQHARPWPALARCHLPGLRPPRNCQRRLVSRRHSGAVVRAADAVLEVWPQGRFGAAGLVAVEGRSAEAMKMRRTALWRGVEHDQAWCPSRSRLPRRGAAARSHTFWRADDAGVAGRGWRRWLPLVDAGASGVRLDRAPAEISRSNFRTTNYLDNYNISQPMIEFSEDVLANVLSTVGGPVLMPPTRPSERRHIFNPSSVEPFIGAKIPLQP
jgi:hypothetical protein